MMPDTPDFDQLARTVVPFCLGIKTSNDVVEACGIVAAQLRLVWNARGAADIARLEALDVMVSADTLRSLDR
jgi:hypothetical protein